MEYRINAAAYGNTLTVLRCGAYSKAAFINLATFPDSVHMQVPLAKKSYPSFVSLQTDYGSGPERMPDEHYQQ